MRIGHGFDIHKFGGNGPIIIGGVKIPYEKGLIAHSDGDVALHALIDAILGAVSLGDIGSNFPDTNIKYKNINSEYLLREAYSNVLKKGYCISNIDITLIIQLPNISSYVTNMRKNIANNLNCNINDVSVKATTTEKLGFIGREEGIACEALVLLINDNSNVNNKNTSVAVW